MTKPTPLLLLPGLMNDARVWQPLTAELQGEREVLVASTHHHDAISSMAQDAIAAMPPGPFAVAGFSLGGYVALEVFRQVPHRVIGLALVSTGARVDSDEAKQARIRMVGAIGQGSADLGQIAESFASRVVHPSRLVDKKLLSLLADMAAQVGQTGFVHQQKAAMARLDSRDLLPTLSSPSIVVCGQQDQITPLGLSEEMARLMPNAELVSVEECGHMSILEQPRVVVPALRQWLKKVDSQKKST